MFVCNCNGLNETAIKEAIIEGGAKKVRDIFAFHGCTAQCKQCPKELASTIRNSEHFVPKEPSLDT